MTEIKGNWRAIESASFRGDWGVETDDPDLVDSGDEIVLYPCTSREIAQLIAAAPDLLKALTDILSNHETAGAGASIFQCTTRQVEAARAAVARATIGEH